MKSVFWFLVAAVLCAALLPERGTDIGELQPVGLLQVYRDGNEIVLETDTADSGSGETLAAALRNLRATTPGNLFLDTAEYLLISPDTAILLPELSAVLRPGTEVCVAVLPVSGEAAMQYLAAHSPGANLMRAANGQDTVPMLKTEEGRFELVR